MYHNRPVGLISRWRTDRRVRGTARALRLVEAAALCRGDIGIAPTPSDQWTLGKCGFKILQYMAAGLPVIASPVGANEQIVQEGVTGILPSEPAKWPAAIARLAADPDLRARM